MEGEVLSMTGLHTARITLTAAWHDVTVVGVAFESSHYSLDISSQ